jgi:hypothetical protein
MTTMHDRIRTTFPAVDDRGAAERVMRATQALLDAPGTRRRRARRPVRVLAVALAIVIAIAGIAIAAEPGLLHRIFPSGSGAARMDVFQHPTDVSDHPDLPGSYGHVLETMADVAGTTPDDAHVLLHHRKGALEVTGIAIPARDGSVCLLWATNAPGVGFGSCSPILPGLHEQHSTPFIGNGDGTGYVPMVAGMIDDSVTDVRIRLDDGTVVPAVRGENAYLWIQPQLAEAGARGTRPRLEVQRPVAILLDFDDGSSQAVRVAQVPRSAH